MEKLPVKTAFEYPLDSSRITELNKKKCKIEQSYDGKLIKDFGSYTTLHGVHFIFDSGTAHRRIFWICLIFFGVCSLTIQLFYNISRLNSNETRIRKSVELSESLDFPAVTICNQNMLKKSKIQGTQAQDYLDQLDELKFLLMGLQNKNVPSFDLERVVQRSGHRIQDMVHDCKFVDSGCSWKNFTSARMSFMHGNCYTFNGGNNGSTILRIPASGKMQSLTLRLDSENHEYYGPFSYDATGFKIAVHDQGNYVEMSDKGYDISPGFYTNIRVKKNKEISLPSPYHSMCGSRKLLNFDSYSRQSCRLECLSKIITKECNCRVLSTVRKGINVTRFCSTDEIKSCAFPAYRKSVLSLGPDLCDCPLECEAISYNVQLSTAYFPSEHLLDALLPLMAKLTGLNTSNPEERAQIQPYVRKRYAMVSIFFETLDIDVVQESPSYTLTNFWSDIGGNMGLFLGCSMMTICEVIDLIFMMCLHRWRKRAQQVSGKCTVQSIKPAS